MAKYSSTARLQRDLEELKREPLDGVYALPLEQDIHEWHVNMVAKEGSYKGMVLHLQFNFPKDYPIHPPKLRICSTFHHPHTHGSDYICLDMLSPREEGYMGAGSTWSTWSSAYSVSNVLAQLYGFLLVDDTIMSHGYQTRLHANEYVDYASCFRDAANFKCSRCPHTGICPYPPVSTSTPAKGQSMQVTRIGENPSKSPALATPDSEPVDRISQLHHAVLRLILAWLPAEDLWRCQHVSQRFRQFAIDVHQRSELQCYFTKLPFTEVVLGYGVSRQWHHGSPPQLKGLTSPLELLSLDAFNSGLRHSVWGNSFECFLPLYLNPEHSSRSLPLLAECINRICSPGVHQVKCALHVTEPSGTSRRQAAVQWTQRDAAAAVLRVLSQLMTSLVVEMVGWDKPGNVVTRHLSDAALSSFCHLHHLLLAVAAQPGSVLVEIAEEDVLRFVRSPACRTKEDTPDLGLLLVKYMLTPRSSVSWGEFAPVLLREALSRQVRWLLRDAPWLALPGADPIAPGQQEPRLKAHFEGARISLRTINFQVWFANALARPSTASDIAAIKAEYDELNGMPPEAKFTAFNQHSRAVLQCSGWMQYLQALRMGIRSQLQPRATVLAALRQAVVDSATSKYHVPPHKYRPAQYLDWSTEPFGVTTA